MIMKRGKGDKKGKAKESAAAEEVERPKDTVAAEEADVAKEGQLKDTTTKQGGSEMGTEKSSPASSESRARNSGDINLPVGNIVEEEIEDTGMEMGEGKDIGPRRTAKRKRRRPSSAVKSTSNAMFLRGVGELYSTSILRTPEAPRRQLSAEEINVLLETVHENTMMTKEFERRTACMQEVLEEIRGSYSK